jgi:CheY-like chemotaxis protein
MQPDTDRKCVLIVEDDSIMGLEMKELIEGFGYCVPDVLTRGEAVVAAVREYNPDVVMMDIRLERRYDRIDAAREVRQVSQVPVIFLTGYKNAGPPMRWKRIHVLSC